MLSARRVFQDAWNPRTRVAQARPRRSAKERNIDQQAKCNGEGADEGKNHTAAYSIPIGIELIDLGNEPFNRP